MWAVCQLTKRLNTAVDEIAQAGSFGEMSQRHHHSELGDLGQAGDGREGAAGGFRLYLLFSCSAAMRWFPREREEARNESRAARRQTTLDSLTLCRQTEQKRR